MRARPNDFFFIEINDCCPINQRKMSNSQMMINFDLMVAALDRRLLCKLKNRRTNEHFKSDGIMLRILLKQLNKKLSLSD